MNPFLMQLMQMLQSGGSSANSSVLSDSSFTPNDNFRRSGSIPGVMPGIPGVSIDSPPTSGQVGGGSNYSSVSPIRADMNNPNANADSIRPALSDSGVGGLNPSTNDSRPLSGIIQSLMSMQSNPSPITTPQQSFQAGGGPAMPPHPMRPTPIPGSSMMTPSDNESYMPYRNPGAPPAAPIGNQNGGYIGNLMAMQANNRRNRVRRAGGMGMGPNYAPAQ